MERLMALYSLLEEMRRVGEVEFKTEQDSDIFWKALKAYGITAIVDWSGKRGVWLVRLK